MRHKIRWTSRKIAQRLRLIESLVYRQRQPIPPFRFLKLDSPTTPPPATLDVDDSAWDEIPAGTYWSGPRTNFILRTRFTIPDLWRGAGPIALFLPIGIAGDFSHPEALVYIDGEPLAACDRHHQEIILPEKYCDGEEHSLALHGWTGGVNLGIDPDTKLLMRPCEVVQIHQPTRDFVTLARVALGVSKHLEERDPAKHHLLTALDEAFKVLDIRQPIGEVNVPSLRPPAPNPGGVSLYPAMDAPAPNLGGISLPPKVGGARGRERIPGEAFYASIPAALATLRAGVAKSGPPLEVDITAVGHAHIDIAWLWILGQTRQKAARTFHNVLRLMEDFPEFRFAQSQPQLYEYIRGDYPKLFAAIKERIAEGRWEPLGGMWVEADCNLSGPESLARQFLLGRNFFRQHFGEDVDSPVLWLPDVFGYAWNLPQLIKEAGLEYFFTIKMGWSQYNRIPYDSFWWQGIDGTRVLTHFSTTKNPDSPHASTYNSNATPSQTLGTWLNFQQKDYAPPGEIPPLLMSYGWGDGGGGPTREMLENIREMRHFPATPQIHTGKVIDFFRELEAVSENLPTWNGELYLEYHRGTYTTQARVKRANRKSEFLLHDAEFLAVYASILDIGYSYPHSQFRQAWELVCLNQFHDIIPGSSIGPVYEESLEQYAQVCQSMTEIRDQALGVIAAKLGGDHLVVNPTSFARGEPISVGEELADVGALPPYSVSALHVETLNVPCSNMLTCSPALLENDYLRVEFDKTGDITRIYDKLAAREVLPPGAIANQFQAFEDIPLSWDAWDIDIFYDDKMWLAEAATSVKVVEAGPLRATLEVQRRILNSSYTQRISLIHNSPRLDFDTHIDWQERQILLKVAFPVDVLAPTATYEIQWGNVERPTHRNTSWDWARFETCAQKWVDLSEGNYGVSLLNDCKYGHDIQNNIMRLTLLRGTTAPDPEADLGEHHFAYSLLPHAGGWGVDTVREAYALNDPVIVWAKQEGTRYKGLGTRDKETKSLVPSHSSLVTTNHPNIVIETIKQAEDGHGIIVRLYESQRKRGPFTLTTCFPINAAWRTNILEENQEEIPVEDTQLHYTIKPYQILTFRLRPEKQIDSLCVPLAKSTLTCETDTSPSLSTGLRRLASKDRFKPSCLIF